MPVSGVVWLPVSVVVGLGEFCVSGTGVEDSRTTTGLGVAVGGLGVGVRLLATLSTPAVCVAAGGEVAVGLYTPADSMVDVGCGTGVFVAPSKLVPVSVVGCGVRLGVGVLAGVLVAVGCAVGLGVLLGREVSLGSGVFVGSGVNVRVGVYVCVGV